MPTGCSSPVLSGTLWNKIWQFACRNIFQQSICPPIGIDALFICNEFVRMQIHFWIHVFESIRERPMGGAASPVHYTCSCQDKRPRTHARYFRPGLVLPAYPIEHYLLLSCVFAGHGRWNNNEVCLCNIPYICIR